MGIPTTERAVGKGGERIRAGGPRRVLDSLPPELLVNVLARVASTSFTDLFNAKLCCRDFFGAAENEYILQHISIDKFPVIHWFPPSKEVVSFLDRCKIKGNPEALFRQGMIEYFSSRKVDLGMEHLKRAAEKGHVEANYVYGIILLCREGQSRQRGSQLLSFAKNSCRSRNRKLHDCRARIKGILRRMWINNDMSRPQASACGCCDAKGGVCLKKKEPWILEEEEEDGSRCDACTWNREAAWFCKMLRGFA